MDILVTVYVHADVCIFAVTAAAEKEAASLKKILLGSPNLCNKYMYGVISTVYVSLDCTPYSVTLVLLMTDIGD